MTGDPLELPYSDNDRQTVGERLVSEIEADPEFLDVCSGYFAPSAWAAIGGGLEQLRSFRLLIGKDHELERLDTRSERGNIEQLVRQAIKHETEPEHLASREEAEQVEALIAFLERVRERGEAVKLWRGDGFLHAKAYILAGSAGIGSANFTFSGLSKNRELVGWRQDRSAVRDVRDWFEGYWKDPRSEPYTDRLIELLRDTPLVSDAYTPYEVLIRTLAGRYGSEQPPSLEAAQFNLKWFQEDAVFRLVKLLNGRSRAALLADAVGLGKTFMAMGVIHHYLYAQAERRGRGKPVLLVVPASLRDTWQRELDAAGLDWACAMLTTQSLRADFDTRPFAGADLIVIDEAHRLRGGATWFRKMMDLVTYGEGAQEKRVLLLTATPVNTSMEDLVNLLRVMTKGNRAVWAPEIADFERYLDRVDRGDADPFPLLDRALVRRSRSDVLDAYKQARAAGQHVEALRLPARRTEHIDYDYESGGGDLFERFADTLRALSLAPYDLERFRSDRPTGPEALPLVDSEGRELAHADAVAFTPGSLAALYASGLLTRFQSSVPAVRKSLHRLDAVLRRYGEALAVDPPRLLDLKASPRVRALVNDEAAGRDRDSSEEVDTEAADGLTDEELERAWTEALAAAPELEGHDTYRLDEIQGAIERDRREIAALLAALPQEPDDGKFAALERALNAEPRAARRGAPGLAGRRVLIFSQFRDTARYLHRRLSEAEDEFGRVELIDGAVSATKRREITAFFDPHRAGEADLAARAAGEQPPQLLISTDVLAEGHNLQLADTVVNFDLHFNPQVAVQRAGRIDRLESPHDTVVLVSMLPPERLDRHIGLLGRLNERFRRIHGLGLGDERVMPLASDVPGQTLEQMRRLYEQDDASVLDEIERSWAFGSTDYMRIPLATFLTRAGRDKLADIPVGVSSVKQLPNDWRHAEGVFIALSATDTRSSEPEAHWRFYAKRQGGSYGEALRDEVEIFHAIACTQGEPRADLDDRPDGPGVYDWQLVRRAAEELAGELTLQRSQAELHRGASERSRRLRSQLRADTEGVEVAALDALLDRLLQVRVEDYDGRSGWRGFEDARRRLRRAETAGERRDAAVEVVTRGRDLFGAPEEEPEEAQGVEVAPDSLRLVAYEALVERAAAPVPAEQAKLDV